ncbi:hypothetical protein [Nonomuraea rubra]|uniref:hypothetical protein n=1 Tax=Nonomuraea rubra TaxID=46180 RepID=UPI003408EC09
MVILGVALAIVSVVAAALPMIAAFAILVGGNLVVGGFLFERFLGTSYSGGRHGAGRDPRRGPARGGGPGLRRPRSEAAQRLRYRSSSAVCSSRPIR